MVVRGKVKNGKVVLTDPKALPEGMDVEVRPVKKLGKPETKKPATRPVATRGKSVGRARKTSRKRTKRVKYRPGSFAERLAPLRLRRVLYDKGGSIWNSAMASLVN